MTTIPDRMIRRRQRTRTTSGDPAALGLHIIDLVRKYIDLAEHEYMAVALWILHTHVFDHFMYSPRLVLTSPAPECGKTELLSICELLSWNARRIDNTSAAYLYDLAHTEHPTLLLDEGDNAEITPGALLAFILSGHRRGAIFGRGIGPNRKNYKTFGAVAFAKIGMDLPPALALRSFIIRMQRNVRPLKKLTREDLAPASETDFTRTYRLIRRWAHKVSPSLSQDPPIPSELRGRQGDNWTAPLSIANTFGAMFGEAARQAAVVFAHRSRGDSIRVAALEDCCRVIAAAGVRSHAERGDSREVRRPGPRMGQLPGTKGHPAAAPHQNDRDRAPPAGIPEARRGTDRVAVDMGAEGQRPRIQEGLLPRRP